MELNVNLYLAAVDLTIRRNYSFIEHFDLDTHSQDIYLNRKWFLSSFKLNPRLMRYVKNHKDAEVRGHPFASFVKLNPDIKNFLDDLTTIRSMVGVNKNFSFGRINFYVK